MHDQSSRLCACGCGTVIPAADSKGRPRTFVKGHNYAGRSRAGERRRGARGPRPTLTGYVRVWAPGHPLAHRDGYVLEHRLVAYDAGLLTNPADHVHHVNGDKTDNRVENLAVMSGAEHLRLHVRESGEVENQYGRWPLRRLVQR
jgi:hypothetical protein